MTCRMMIPKLHFKMTLPFFYKADLENENQILLDEPTSLHIVQVLRMKEGEKLNLTDGRGSLFESEILSAHKKHCTVSVLKKAFTKPSEKQVIIAVSLLKNNSRFEWFLEKATELGIAEIIPLICERTEKEKFRIDRLQQIVISAMLQSQQCWLPVLHQPVAFEKLNGWKNGDGQNFIAHCEEGDKLPLTKFTINKHYPALICIGPEGDFTKNEIALALENDFIPVSLGDNRLRTETAAIVASVLLCA